MKTIVNIVERQGECEMEPIEKFILFSEINRKLDSINEKTRSLEKCVDEMLLQIRQLKSSLREIKEYAPANMFPADSVFHVVGIVDDALRGD